MPIDAQSFDVVKQLVNGELRLPHRAYIEVTIGGLDQRTYDAFGASDDVETSSCDAPGCDCLSEWKRWELAGGAVMVQAGMPLRRRSGG